MPPDAFWTELHDSLTAFYENILKKAGAGGRPVAKPLICKFVTKTTTMPEAAPSSDADADANAVEPLPPTLHRRWPLRQSRTRAPRKNRPGGGAADQRVGPAVIGGQNRADFFKSLRESAKSAVRALFADFF